MSLTELAIALGDVLRATNATVTTAESCTGGGIAEAITHVPGSSQWFDVGFITYSNAQKNKLLNVPSNLMEQDGAVSQSVVEAMVRAACDKGSARFGVAVSGIAGPEGGSVAKPVGTVWVAWYDASNELIYSHCYHFLGDRAAVRQQTVVCALRGLVMLVTGKSPLDG